MLRPPRSTRTYTRFPYLRSSDLPRSCRRARRARALPADLPRPGSGAAALAADRRRSAALSGLQRSPRLTSAPNMEERTDIVTKPTGFADWTGLLALLRESYALMAGRTHPPSSLHRYTSARLAAQAGAQER